MSSYRPGWPWTHRDPLASTSWVPGLKVCATTTWLYMIQTNSTLFYSINKHNLYLSSIVQKPLWKMRQAFWGVRTPDSGYCVWCGELSLLPGNRNVTEIDRKRGNILKVAGKDWTWANLKGTRIFLLKDVKWGWGSVWQGLLSPSVEFLWEAVQNVKTVTTYRD